MKKTNPTKPSGETAVDELTQMPAQTAVELGRGRQWRLTKGGILVMRLHHSAVAGRDPKYNPRWKETERRKYTAQAAWDREQEIEFRARLQLRVAVG
jgi:hypothetical protein